MSRKKDNSVLLENRRAYHDYFLSDFMTAGLVLTGTEIKSLRAHNATISDAYIVIRNQEVYVINMHIAPYREGNIFNVNHLRARKLLLTKQEIGRLQKKITATGCTCVPVKLFLSHGYAKLEIAVAKGKKLHDKREALKEKDLNREAQKGNRVRDYEE